MAGIGPAGSLPILWGSTQLPTAGQIPRCGETAMAPDPKPPEPKGPHHRTTDEPTGPTLASDSANLSTVSRRATGRHDPRQEPGAVIPPAGIRVGGGGQPPSLPRLEH